MFFDEKARIEPGTGENRERYHLTEPSRRKQKYFCQDLPSRMRLIEEERKVKWGIWSICGFATFFQKDFRDGKEKKLGGAWKRDL